MWSVQVVSKNIKDGRLVIDLVYTDGITTLNESLNTHLAQSDTWLAENVARRVDQLTALYTYADKVTVGPIDYTVKIQPPTTEVIKTAFSDKIATLRKLQALNNAGINVTTEISTIKTAIANDYAAHPELAIEVV